MRFTEDELRILTYLAKNGCDFFCGRCPFAESGRRTGVLKYTSCRVVRYAKQSRPEKILDKDTRSILLVKSVIRDMI